MACMVPTLKEFVVWGRETMTLPSDLSKLGDLENISFFW